MKANNFFVMIPVLLIFAAACKKTDAPTIEQKVIQLENQITELDKKIDSSTIEQRVGQLENQIAELDGKIVEHLDTPSSTNKDGKIWTCQATTSNDVLFLVDQLDRTRDTFDLAIFENNNNIPIGRGDYIGTVNIQITQNDGKISGNGSLDGRNINVRALGRGPAFEVEDSVEGNTSGGCSINLDVASDEYRKLVRDCLSLVKNNPGIIATVQMPRCATHPTKSIQNLNSQLDEDTPYYQVDPKYSEMLNACVKDLMTWDGIDSENPAKATELCEGPARGIYEHFGGY